ncbi:MAG: hypothetical protein LBD35_03175 [Prevotellaceae bacterium]|jgi:hypothetical protein|nr:hypothetical protein [Prevotellaceae bacterium]
MKKTLYNMDFGRLLLLSLIVCAAQGANARREAKNLLGISYFRGWNDYSANGMYSGALTTVQKYDGGITHRIEIEYARAIGRNFEVRTGVSAAGAYFGITSHYFPGQSTYYSDDVLFVFSIPAHLKYCFLKYLFVEAGPDLNFHPSMGYKRGWGLSGCAGAEYAFPWGMKFSVCVLAQQNWLNLGTSEHVENGYTLGKDTLSQIGLKIGIGYRF